MSAYWEVNAAKDRVGVVAPGSEYRARSTMEAIQLAAENGYVVVLPKPNQLQIDIDSEEDLKAFEKQVPCFERLIARIVNVKQAPSKSGDPGKFHITVTLNRVVTPLERVLFQLMLASDRTREVLNYSRLMAGDPVPTLFFEKAP